MGQFTVWPSRICRPTGRPSHWGPSDPQRTTVTIALLLLLSALAVAALAYSRYRPNRRDRAMRDVLDAADALEAQLRVARAEIEAVTGGEGNDPVGEAMREMLRQRLWLRDHGPDASLAQLDEVRSSIDAARSRIDQQLSLIAQARAPVA